MPSTLGFALLALLARRGRTGYELKQAMQEPIGFFWRASHSQIYPELGRLENAGLVRHKVVDGPGPLDTKRYQITAAGRRTLAEWATVPPAPAPDRDEMMLKVYSAWTADPQATIAMVEHHLAQHREQLARYEAFEREYGATPPVGSPEFGGYATLRAGLSYERHRVAWCEWLLGELRRPV